MDKRVLVSLFENGDVWECECGRRMMWKVSGEE